MRKRSKEKLAKAIKKEAKEQYFCPLAFDHLYSDSAGRWRLCCRAYPFDHTVSDTTPEQHWNHPIMREIRSEMLSGDLKQVRKYCHKCLKAEKDGLKSARQQLNAKLMKGIAAGKRSKTLQFAARLTQGSDQNSLPDERVLELKLRIFGNYCNLRCYMCAPANSTSRHQELSAIRDGHWLKCLKPPEKMELFNSEEDYDEFVDSIVRLLPAVKKIKITGGEPFLLRRHYKFLEKIVATAHASQIRLAYDSNMTKFEWGSSNVLDYLEKFKAVTLAVSVDNVGARNDYIRYGANFDEVIANIETAREMPGINVVVSCATGMLNAGDVHDIAEFFHQRGIMAKFNMCVITAPAFLQARHLPDPLKEQYLARIENSPFIERFANVIRMIKQPRDENEFDTFLDYMADLDQHRSTRYLDLWPEFEPYQKPKQ
ncbi:MAG: MoaA/NifB/PqqE/SkfB family radical SAM enzyme [Verrucomicrobiales bacterium]|jgi:MoaA/NifB/PqqE/SkfB family radical SAM enzyme